MIDRRTFLEHAGFGLGAAALHSLAPQGPAPALPPRIRRVIFLCMAGGPSQLETFDYKPELEKRDGQPMPASSPRTSPSPSSRGRS